MATKNGSAIKEIWNLVYSGRVKYEEELKFYWLAYTPVQKDCFL